MPSRPFARVPIRAQVPIKQSLVPRIAEHTSYGRPQVVRMGQMGLLQPLERQLAPLSDTCRPARRTGFHKRCKGIRFNNLNWNE